MMDSTEQISALVFDIERELLTKEFNKDTDASKAANEAFDFLKFEAMFHFFNHLSTQIDGGEQELSKYSIEARSGFKVDPFFGKWKVSRRYTPEDFSIKEINLLPSGNPDQESSWSVMFEVKDEFGVVVDKHIMANAPIHKKGDLSSMTESQLIAVRMLKLLREDVNSFLKSQTEAINNELGTIVSNIKKLKYETIPRKAERSPISKPIVLQSEFEERLQSLKVGFRNQLITVVSAFSLVLFLTISVLFIFKSGGEITKSSSEILNINELFNK